MDIKRYIILVIVLLIVWVGAFYIILNYAKELRSHPCSLCAEKMGDDVKCISTVDGSYMIFTDEGDIEVKWVNMKS